MFVAPADEAVDVCLGQEDGPAEWHGAREDFRRLAGHEHGGLNSGSGTAQRNNAVALEQDDARRRAVTVHEFRGSIPDALGQLQAGIGVGHEDRARAATDDFIGKEAMRRKRLREGRAKDGINRHRMGVTDEVNLRKTQEIGVKERFHGGLFGLWIDATAEERLVDLVVRDIRPVEQREERRGRTFDKILLPQSGKIAAAGFDEKGVMAQLRGRIAFTQDRQFPMVHTEFVGEFQQGPAMVIEYAHGDLAGRIDCELTFPRCGSFGRKSAVLIEEVGSMEAVGVSGFCSGGAVHLKYAL